jgi:uncharacterized protein (TIGR04255 family)
VQLHRGEFGFTLNAGGASIARSDHGLVGYRVDSADGQHVAQFRTDGFTFSRLPPYETFDQMRDQARRLWAIYSGCLKPENVTRLAVRYINVMELPMGGFDFREFLTAPPALPARLPQGFSSFLERIVFQDPATAASVVLTQAFEGVAGDGRFPVTVDIDAFRDRDFEPSDRQIWSYFDTLRELKNDVFFESITEKTARLYE